MYPTISHLIKDITGYWLPLPIQTFGFFVAISLIVSYFILYNEIKRKARFNLISGSYDKDGIFIKPEERVSTIVIIALLFGFIGARLFSILEYPQEFFEAPIHVLFSEAGFTFYGGLIFGVIAAIIYAKKAGISLVPLCDAASPPLILGYAIGRLGCHMSGDGDWGINNLLPKPDWLSFLPDWLWAYNYPHNVVREGIEIPGCYEKFCTVLESPVFPTSLYEMIFCSISFLILWIIRKKIVTSGIMFSIYLIINGIERFLIEQIRVDAEYNIRGMYVKQSEIISVLIIIIGIFIFYLSYKKRKKRKFR